MLENILNYSNDRNGVIAHHETRNTGHWRTRDGCAGERKDQDKVEDEGRIKSTFRTWLRSGQRLVYSCGLIRGLNGLGIKAHQ